MAFATSKDGLRLAYDDTGRGAPLLCLPGLTRNMADFAPVVERFADRTRVIRMDFRGRGDSDPAPDPASYNVVQEARDVIDLLDHLGVARATILGTSRGGLVAMMLARLARERLSGVIFNDIGPEVMPEGLAAIRGYIGRRPGFATYAQAEAAMPELMPGFTGVSARTWAAHVRALYVQRADGLDLRYDPRLAEPVEAAFAADAPQPDLWPLFDALDPLPLGLIRGAASNILSAATAAEMQRRRPDMRLAELPDRGHVPFLDEPAAVAVIADVLDRVG